MTEGVPAQGDYEDAKDRQADNPRAFAAKDPAEWVLEDVATIRAFEAEQERIRFEAERAELPEVPYRR